MYQVKTPVALLIFNRPDTTRAVFERVAEVRPRQLFIVADGPRRGKPGEEERCAAARKVMDDVDWDCDVEWNIADENLGCRRRVSSGLDWVFSRVDRAVILEDDCIPARSFFRFCDDLLDRYEHDARVMSLCGTNLVPAMKPGPESYYFSRNCYVWGWATWRRAWAHFDVEMTQWPAFRDEGRLQWVVPDDAIRRSYERNFQAVYDQELDSWAFAWRFACWSQSGFTVLPVENLISNVGFGPAATHTCDERDPFANRPRTELQFPLRHPQNVVPFLPADCKVEQLYHRGYVERAWRKLRRICRRAMANRRR